MKSEPTPYQPVYPQSGQPNPYAQAHAAVPPPPVDPRPLNQQYRSHAAPTFNPAPQPEAPQFATFDSGKKIGNEDALPAMPSWSDARDVHVQVEEPAVPEKKGDVEMDRLHNNGSAASGSMAGVAAAGGMAAAAAGQRRSPGAGRSPIQRSPTGDSYGYDQGFEREPLVGGAGAHRDSPGPYNRPYAQQDDYRRGSPAQNLSPVYGQGEGYNSSRSPQPQRSYYSSNGSQAPYSDHNDSYAQMPQAPVHRYDSPSPPSYHTNAPNGNAPYDNFAPSPVQQRSYDPPAPAPAQSPVSAYPGQRSYTPVSGTSYPGQQTYQAFNPGQSAGQQQHSGVQRKAVDGLYRDV